MNLFLLSLLCLPGAVMSQVWPELVTVLYEGTYPNDLEVNLIDQLESNGTTKNYLAELLKMDSVSSLRQTCNTSSGCPLFYLEALKTDLKIFDEDSSINPVIGNDTKENIPKEKYMYSCKRTINQLKHFYISATSEICFLPFPNTQTLAFAKCELKGRCWRSEQEATPSGSCRPSCFARHKLHVICMKIDRPLKGYWKSLLVNLPQFCSCSA